jgi:hypothetical protein
MARIALNSEVSMFARTLLTLALTGGLGVGSATAQASASAVEVPGASVFRSTSDSADPFIHRIFTLAWTDIILPASLAATSQSAAPAADPPGRRIFTLTWQTVADASNSSNPAATRTAPACERTILIAVPCESQ